MKGSKIEKMLAFLLLITLTMANFLYVGTGIVIAESEDLESQSTKIGSTNVSFDVFYEGNVHSKELNMEEGGTITCSIDIENAGIVDNATIHVDNPNFKIQTDKLDSTYIKSINEEKNEIELNHLVAGKFTIQIPIVFEQKDVIPTDYFDKTNTFTFAGEYKIDSNKATKIEKEIKVATKWNVKPEAKIQGEFTKYLSIGENGILLEHTITATTNNVLPKEKENIVVDVPILDDNKPSSVVVLLNGEKIDAKYDSENNQVKIEQINSVKEDKITWTGSNDVYKVISTYPKGTALTERQIPEKVTASTKFYGSAEEIQNNIEQELTVQEKGQALETKYTVTDSVYKGYMQNAIQDRKTELQEELKVQFASKDMPLKGIEMGKSSFVDAKGTEQPIQNSYYEKTVLNKQQISSIFGDNFSLTIENVETNETIQVVTNSTEADEQGNITITYPENVKMIRIKTEDTVQNVGEIAIQNTKYIIGDTGYTKEIVKTFNTIKNTATILGEQDLNTVVVGETKLNDTQTKAEFLVSTDKLAMLQKNENVEMTMTLLSYDIMHELYKNPTVEIELPEGIENIAVKSINKAYSDEIQVEKAQLVTNEQGKKIIKIQMSGEQTQYSTTTYKGLTIKILCDITMSKDMAAHETEIIARYTNENSKEKYEEKQKINIVLGEEIAQPDIPTPTVEPEETQEQQGQQGQQETTNESQQITTSDTGVTLQVTPVSNGKVLEEGTEVYEGQNIVYKLKIKNGTKEEIKNVKVIANHENAIFYNYVKKQVIVTEGEDPIKYYYKEDPELKQLEIDIEKIAAGETVEKQYEVSVAEVKGEQKLSGNIKIDADDMEEVKIDTVTNPIKQAEQKIVLTGNNMLGAKQYKTGSQYSVQVDIKNYTDNTQTADVYMVLPEFMTFEDTEDENVAFVSFQNQLLHLKINDIKAGKTTTKVLLFNIKEFNDEDETKEMLLQATSQFENGTSYTSNIVKDTIVKGSGNVEITLKADYNKETIPLGQEITYTGTISNNTSENLEKSGEIQLVIEKSKSINVKTVQIDDDNYTKFTTDKDGNIVIPISSFEKGTKKEIKIQAAITENESDVSEDETYATMKINLTAGDIKVTSPSVYFSIGVATDDTEDEENEENKGDKENSNQNDKQQETKTYSIKGTAWVDKNKNGTREEYEEIFANTKVVLIDVSNNSKEIKKETTTDSKGNYVFENVEKGNYIIGFAYDKDTYQMAEYHKQGVSEDKNSDVIKDFENNGNIYAITDILEIKAENLANIDAGFIKRETFDFSLQKYISRVTIKDSKNVKTVNYEDTQFAKAEIDSKLLGETVVLIEYDIVIKNEGDLAGYIKDIVDYIPADLEFQSSINKEWYQDSKGILHTNSISGEKIQPGETRTVRLTLSKNMTKNNLGMVSNLAEIADSQNDLQAKDIDSTPGNRKDGEDDISTAQMLISVKTGLGTGANITIIALVGAIIVGAIIYIVKRKEDKHEKTNF